MAAGDGIRETVSTDVLGAVTTGGAPAVRPKHPFEQVFHRNAAAMLIATPLDLRILDVNQRQIRILSAPALERIAASDTGGPSEVRRG